MRAPGTTPHGVGTGTRLITRRHVDYCRTASAFCPSARR
ncbi:putative leader peptide [Streptomyces sp. NPDC058295]